MQFKILIKAVVNVPDDKIAEVCAAHNKEWDQPEGAPVERWDFLTRAKQMGIIDGDDCEVIGDFGTDFDDTWVIDPDDADDIDPTADSDESEDDDA